MYKLIACDMDETLIGHDHKISAADIKSIASLKACGVKFVPASGRGYASIDRTLRELGLLDEPNQYVISFNGGAITENKAHRLLHCEPLDFALAEEFYRRGLEHDVCIHVYTLEEVYVNNFVRAEREYLDGRMEVIETDETTLDFLRGQDIIKVLYMSTNQDYLRELAAGLSDITPDVDVTYSSNRYLEFNRKGVTKGAGLRRLAEILGIELRETIAIGDNFNDLTMICAAGVGAAVDNAVDELKAQADYVCRADCDHSAVSEVIARFID